MDPNQIGDYLDLDGGELSCAKCEESLGDVASGVKSHLIIQELEVGDAGPSYKDIDIHRFINENYDLVFREYYCPSCGTLFFTETARKEDPVIEEISLDL
jgi:acetone carboxylase gamma subunit